MPEVVITTGVVVITMGVAWAGRVPRGGRLARYSALPASEWLSTAAWWWKLAAAASLTAFSSCFMALRSANMPWLCALSAAFANSFSVYLREKKI